MSSRGIWVVAGACWLAGLGLLYAFSDGSGASDVARGMAIFLMIVPIAVGLNITVGRRQRVQGEDSPDSVEFQGARTARAEAYVDTVILAAVLVLVLAIAPGDAPALWGVMFLIAAVSAFWLRYARVLRSLRG